MVIGISESFINGPPVTVNEVTWRKCDVVPKYAADGNKKHLSEADRSFKQMRLCPQGLESRAKGIRSIAAQLYIGAA